MHKVRVGLTDTYYAQIRVILENMGGEAVDLVTPQTMASYFKGESQIGGGAITTHNAPFLLRNCPVDYFTVPLYEQANPLDRWILDYRQQGGAILDEACLGKLIDLHAVGLQVAKLDGLLVAGGEDINPYYYADSMCGTEQQHRTRDIIELAFIREARLQQKPIFAICRGAQVLAVALGGTLVQDIPSTLPAVGSAHGLANEYDKAAGHQVQINRDSLLARYMKVDQQQGVEARISINVNSYHHQAVATLAGGAEAVAWAGGEGGQGESEIIEGFVVPSNTFIAGVQWHPERPLLVEGYAAAMAVLDWKLLERHWRAHDRALFESFIAAADGGLR